MSDGELSRRILSIAITGAARAGLPTFLTAPANRQAGHSPHRWRVGCLRIADARDGADQARVSQPSYIQHGRLSPSEQEVQCSVRGIHARLLLGGSE